MRRTRGLTSAERWELGLFLVMLVTGLLCLTAIMKLDGLPRLLAFASPRPAAPTPELMIQPASAPPLMAIAPAPAPAAAPAPAPIAPRFTVTELAPAAPLAQPRPAPKKPAVEYKYFGGEKYRFVKTLRMRVTAYAPDAKCCWPYDGTTTASGLSVKTNHGRLVAADTRIVPMYALVSIPGYHDSAPVPVLDRGGAIKGNRLDVLLPTFDQAKSWGSRTLEVKIYEPVE
jgi:3D (Asp-Asp-Asp) domain-containing protein